LATIIPVGVLVALFASIGLSIDDTHRVTPKADVGAYFTIYNSNFDDQCNDGGGNPDIASSLTDVSVVDETGKVVATSTAGFGEYNADDGVSCTWYVRFNITVPSEYATNLGGSSSETEATEDTMATEETFTEDTTATEDTSATEDTVSTEDSVMETTTTIPGTGPKYTIKFGNFAEQSFSLSQILLASIDETGPQIVVGTPADAPYIELAS
jgi:hypothetical protein